MSLDEELIELKEAALRASAEGDAAFYDEYLADDARAVTPAGVSDRAAVVAAAAGGGFRSLAVTDTEVTALAPDAGIVTYRATFARPEGEVTVFVSTAYRREATGWKGVLYQQTPLP